MDAYWSTTEQPPIPRKKNQGFGRKSGTGFSVASELRTKAALIETIQHEITLTMRRNLKNAIPKRLQMCLARNGEFVHV